MRVSHSWGVTDQRRSQSSVSRQPGALHCHCRRGAWPALHGSRRCQVAGLDLRADRILRPKNGVRLIPKFASHVQNVRPIHALADQHAIEIVTGGAVNGSDYPGRGSIVVTKAIGYGRLSKLRTIWIIPFRFRFNGWTLRRTARAETTSAVRSTTTTASNGTEPRLPARGDGCRTGPSLR